MSPDIQRQAHIETSPDVALESTTYSEGAEVSEPRHPLQCLLPYAVVPLLINCAIALLLTDLNPDFSLLLVKLPGVLLGISWGWTGLLVCILLGIVMGLPVAAFQGAYVKAKLAEVVQGADFGEVLGHRRAEAIICLPWFVMAAVGYLVGYFWLFPPLGGPLVAANVLWVRLLLYRQHLWLYEFGKAYLRQQQGHQSTARAH